MAMPKVLKNFNLFNDGQTYIGVAEKIKLPDLKRQMEKFRGAGMNGPVKIDMGQEELTIEHEYAGFVSQVFSQWGLAKIDGVLLRFAGALQQDDTGAVKAVEIVMRGRHEEINPPEAEGGKKSNFKVKSPLTYFKYVEDGKVLTEIDLVNMIEIVDGVDRLAEQRRAIGMA
jgi:P2 family phage contractile tail tube protein